MERRNASYLLISVVSAALIGCTASSNETIKPQKVEAEKREQVMLVLDMSLGMTERQNGKAKFEIAQHEFGSWLKESQGHDADVGLVVFGHQNRNDCADIVVEATPEPFEDAVYLGRMAYRLSPIGESPLSESIFKAANQLDPNKGPAKVIVFTDGIDSCGYNPCNITDDLAKDNISLDIRNVDGTDNLTCKSKDPLLEVDPISGADDYTINPEQGTILQALRHDTGEPMSPMKWVLRGGPDDEVYELIDDNPTLDLSRMEATELRGGDYTITGYSGDYTGSSNYTFGADIPEVVYVTLYPDVPHTDE